MKNRVLESLAVAAFMALASAVAIESAARQGRATRPPTYTPSRTPYGQPSLEGVWRVWNLAAYDLEDHPARPGVPAGRGVVVDPPDGKIPYKPEMLVKRKQNVDNSRTSDPWKSADPLAKCYIPGVPRITYLGWPFEIVQTPKFVLINYEWMHQRRIIYTDRAAHMEGVDFWWGIARGRYDGNALVVTITNFNDRTWFDMAGNFHSDALHVIERYDAIAPDTLQYDVTIEDPNVFTRPWKISMPIERQQDIGILDYECHALLDEAGIPITWPRD